MWDIFPGFPIVEPGGGGVSMGAKLLIPWLFDLPPHQSWCSPQAAPSHLEMKLPIEK